MNRNESNAALRKTAPCPIFDADGQLLAGQTFTTAAGECLISLDGAAPVAAAADAVTVGRGLVHYVASQSETNCNVDFVVFFIKKSRLDLATKTTNCTTKIRAKVAGEAGNLFTLAFVQDGAVSPTTGTLTHSTSVDPVSGATLTNYVFTFKDATSTVANFESLITASADLEIDVVGAGATLHTVDAFAAAALSGGLRDASVRQEIDQPSTANAAIALAVWNAIAAGSATYGDLARSDLSMLVGPVQDFTTNTLVFVCPLTGKVRWTVTLGTTGRLTCVEGDLTA